MDIGIRAHDFGRNSIQKLAEKTHDLGFSSIQLALMKALPEVTDINIYLNSQYGKEVSSELAKHDIHIAVFGCYLNYVHPIKLEREKNIDIFNRHLEFAQDFGCHLVGTETGSLNGDYSFHRDNHTQGAFDLWAGSLEVLLRKAEQVGAYVGVEGVTVHIINTPERMRQLIATMSSSALRVIFDPVNFISKDNYLHQDKLIANAIEWFGDKIDVIHMKDFIIKNNEIVEVPLGEGLLNIKFLLKEVDALNRPIPLVIENDSVFNMKRNRDFILDINK